MRSKPTYNTVVGGLANDIATPQQLVDALGIETKNLRRFKIEGNDIHAYIRDEYTLGVLGRGTGMSEPKFPNLTKFLDLDGKVKGFSIGQFRDIEALTEV